VPVTLYSDIFNYTSQTLALDEFSGYFVLSPKERTLSFFVQHTFKRLLDIAVGLLGTLVTLLIFPLVAICILIDDPGPVLYRQEFVKRGGKLGRYWKFRSMRTDGAQILEAHPELRAEYERKFKLVNDPRVTRVGKYLRKYSIDEFPEFVTVLFGGLSFVGPRTISSRETGMYGGRLDKLLSVKPGLTGFWQVMGRQTTTYEDRVKMDMFYIDRWSIWIDIYIIFKTVWKVFTGEGAH
jgi:lipopolysaccharide/colanic/teichoic acid biosynthesis glycosyltransferase